MPIRLNLLAEAQAEEELRRQDPVKRATWLAGFLVGCVVVYYGILLIQTLVQRSALDKITKRVDSQVIQFKQITDNEKKLTEVTRTLAEMHRYATNRFLWGNVLNAIQASTVDDVQFTSFRTEQLYALTEGTKPTRDESDRVIPGKPALVTQRITMIIDAKDTSPTPGDQITKLKTALGTAAFLGRDNTNHNGVNIKLKNLSVPTYDPESGRQAMFFSFECVFPEKVIK